MLKEENISVYIKRKINTFIKNESISNFRELEICEGLCTSLMYPTDDFFLYEYQFETVKKLVEDDEKLYVLQSDWNDVMCSKSSKLVSLSTPIEYSEYRNIWLDCKTLMFSDSFKWILIIDECIEGGIGIFIADCNTVEQFDLLYKRGKRDIVDFFDFHISNERTQKQELPILSDIIELLKHNNQN